MKERFIRSPMLDEIRTVKHLFSTRLGGVSKGVFGEFNLGFATKEERSVVERNHEILADAVDLERENLIWARQVHGDHCLVISEDSKMQGEEADSIITGIPGVMIGVKTADCCPILIAEEKGKVVGAVHSGWKGTMSRNLEKTIEKIVGIFGVGSKSLRISIGPSIGGCCYMVDRKRAECFLKAFPDAAVHIKEKDSGFHLDLKKLNREIALKAGIDNDNIEISPVCTFCDVDRFYSYRRDGDLSGRHYNGIMIRA